jgi:hypothetical protein
MNNLPAFPLHNHGVQTLGMHISGMTLRDYFAAASIEVAMRMVKHDWNTDKQTFYWNQVEREIVASRAYSMADAMLKARDD